VLEQRTGGPTDEARTWPHGPDRTAHLPVRTLTGELERLPGVGGWFVVRVEPTLSRRLRTGAARGFVPVTAGVGGSTWDTSLMPMGDGTLFLALPARVRRAEGLDEGDPVRASVRPRPRTSASRRGRW
jgi:hypothetical protein